MRIGIPKETRPGERRVAATPETVKKLAAAGHAIVVETGAGTLASVTDEAYDRRRCDAGFGCGRAGRRTGAEGPRAPGRGAALDRARRDPGGHAQPVRSRRPAEAHRCRRDRVRARGCTAHDPGSVDGRALLPGQHRRLQGRDDGGRRLSALHADADDGSRHREGRRAS
jgi:hypothetical protein